MGTKKFLDKELRRSPVGCMFQNVKIGALLSITLKGDLHLIFWMRGKGNEERKKR